MSTERETTRIVRSWLEDGVTRLPDRVLDDVLGQLPATPQRRPFWRAWRSTRMSNPVRYAIAAAAVLVVALVGSRFLPSSNSAPGSSPGGPSATPPAASPVPSVQPLPFPSAGPLALGRHPMTVDGVPFTFEIAEPGWTSDGEVFFGKGTELEPDGMSILFWPEAPEFVYDDPCGQQQAPPVGPTAADMAAAIAGMSQLELVSGPTSVTIGGKPAQRVVVHVPDELECVPQQYMLWGNESVSSRYTTGPGSTFSVWIIDVDGTRLQIDAESYPGASPEIGEEMRAIVESIRFE